MRTHRLFAPLALFVVAGACDTNVPDDPGGRIFTPFGVIRGTVLYQGPRPCSTNGHIVGNGILLVFDRRNPPPPNGLAVTAVNFATVSGDVLFANEPRYTGSDVYCPYEHGFTDTVNATSPFAISPMGVQNADGTVSGGSYEIEAFFDYTGDFLPTFSTRRLPEQGDVGGGAIDTANALEPVNLGNANYQPHFLPVDVGVPQPVPEDAGAGFIPSYLIPPNGFVADNVSVAMGSVLPMTRPYFYAQGMNTTFNSHGGGFGASTVDETVAQDSSCGSSGYGSNNPGPSNCPASAKPCVAGTTPANSDCTAESNQDYYPILTIPQDLAVLAPPATPLPDSANNFEASFPHIKLVFGVPPSSGSYPGELSCAAGGACPQSNPPGELNPFHFQLNTDSSKGSQGSFGVWQNAYFDPDAQQWLPLQIPEGQNVPMLWPQVILAKLADDYMPDGVTPDPAHTSDPASLNAQGSAGNPVVILQGITLFENPQKNPLGTGTVEGDTIYNTAVASGYPNPANGDAVFNSATGEPIVTQQDHLMVALRPSVICFNHLFDNPPAQDTRGVLVSPYSSNTQADIPSTGNQGPIVPTDILTNGDVKHRFQITNLVNSVQFGCLPKGRYAINIVYPDGQAWTVPNEAGACTGTSATGEGATDYANMTCTLKPRPVLYSQGTRAVVEVVGPTNPASCQKPGPATPLGAALYGNTQPLPSPGSDPAPVGSPQNAAFAVPAACLTQVEQQSQPSE